MVLFAVRQAGWLETQSGDFIAVDGDSLRKGNQDYRLHAIDAPELVHWNCTGGPEEWVGTSVAFRIEPSPGGGTVVRFWHGGWEYEDGILPTSSFQWAMYLDSLRAYLQTGTGRPHQAGAAS